MLGSKKRMAKLHPGLGPAPPEAVEKPGMVKDQLRTVRYSGESCLQKCTTWSLLASREIAGTLKPSELKDKSC